MTQVAPLAFSCMRSHCRPCNFTTPCHRPSTLGGKVSGPTSQFTIEAVTVAEAVTKSPRMVLSSFLLWLLLAMKPASRGGDSGAPRARSMARSAGLAPVRWVRGLLGACRITKQRLHQLAASLGPKHSSLPANVLLSVFPHRVRRLATVSLADAFVGSLSSQFGGKSAKVGHARL